MDKRAKKPRKDWFLTEHMANQGVKTQQLADRMRTSYQNIWRWENATRRPSREHEADLEAALNLGPNALRHHPDESGSDAFLAGLSEEAKADIKNYAAYRREQDKRR